MWSQQTKHFLMQREMMLREKIKRNSSSSENRAWKSNPICPIKKPLWQKKKRMTTSAILLAICWRCKVYRELDRYINIFSPHFLAFRFYILIIIQIYFVLLTTILLLLVVERGNFYYFWKKSVNHCTLHIQRLWRSNTFQQEICGEQDSTYSIHALFWSGVKKNKQQQIILSASKILM